MVKSRKNSVLIFVLILVLALSACLVACEKDGEKNDGNKGNTEDEVKAFEVTFMVENAETGDWEKYVTLPVKDLDKLVEPTREGHVFVGWYLDQDCKNIADLTKVSKNLQVFAKFTKLNETYPDCDVTLMVDGEAYGEVLKSHYGAVELPASVAKLGYKFLGWYADEALTKPFENGTVKENINVYAKFEKLPDVYVSYMIPNGDSWKEYKSVKVNLDGTVVNPENPVVDYYKFSDWYTTDMLDVKFEAKNVKANTKVYAKMIPDLVNITINGVKQEAQNLADVVNNKYNPGEGLKFDGWYEDAACSVKWDGKKAVKDLYAKSVAVITINNGYENMYTTEIAPDDVFADPAEQTVTVDGVNVSLEDNILLPYMSKYDLEYVDENGVAIDFAKPVTKSMNITVLWNSKGLKPTKALPKSTAGHYYMQITSFDDAVKNAPVLSFRNKVTYEDTTTVDGEKVTTTETKIVDYIRFYADCLPDTAKKIIIGDGVQVVQGMNGAGASLVEEISFPNSLKIIDNSFNNMPKLKAVNLPEGVEVVISSFFVEAAAHNSTHTLGKANPNFEIAIPDSVKNLAMMPTNLKFSKTEKTAEVGDFYKGADGRIYLNHKDGKVLIADPASFKGVYNDPLLGKTIPYAETIVVPEGVVGIQVGTYSVAFDYLILPSTFKFVNYNADITDYAEIYDIYHQGGTNEDGSTYINDVSGNVLFDRAQFEKADLTQPTVSFTGMEEDTFAITKFVGGGKVVHPVTGGVIEQLGAGQIIFNAAEAPKGLELAFVVEKLDTIPMTQLLSNFVFKDDKNTVNVSCGYETADPFGMGATITMNAFAKIEGKTTITEADIREALIAANPAIEAMLADVNLEFYANNEKITLGEVKSDMYITVKMVETPKLIINSAYRISCDEYQEVFNDPKQYVGDYFVLSGWGAQSDTVKISDLTNLSKEMVLRSFAAGMAKAMQPMIGDYATEAILTDNIMWSFNNATSLKIMMNGEEVTDYSKINLDNGSVTLDIEVEFAPYATQA